MEKNPAKKTRKVAEQPSVNAGHRERMRERFRHDKTALEDYEVLEMLLYNVLKYGDTRVLAKTLLNHFGSFDGLLGATPEEIQSIPGAGEGVAFYCQLLREAQARCVEAPVRRREVFCNTQTIMDFARLRLGNCSHEEVWIATIDTGNRLISWERLCVGTIDASPLYPRDVLETALRNKASGFFLVHNHPGGTLQASRADVDMTKNLDRIAKSIGIHFLDHIIVTEAGCVSMRQSGYK